MELESVNARSGSGPDENPGPRLRPLLRVKQTFSLEKETSIFECLHSGEERTWLVRGCQDRS